MTFFVSLWFCSLNRFCLTFELPLLVAFNFSLHGIFFHHLVFRVYMSLKEWDEFLVGRLSLGSLLVLWELCTLYFDPPIALCLSDPLLLPHSPNLVSSSFFLNNLMVLVCAAHAHGCVVIRWSVVNCSNRGHPLEKTDFLPPSSYKLSIALILGIGVWAYLLFLCCDFCCLEL